MAPARIVLFITAAKPGSRKTKNLVFAGADIFLRALAMSNMHFKLQTFVFQSQGQEFCPHGHLAIAVRAWFTGWIEPQYLG